MGVAVGMAVGTAAGMGVGTAAGMVVGGTVAGGMVATGIVGVGGPVTAGGGGVGAAGILTGLGVCIRMATTPVVMVILPAVLLPELGMKPQRFSPDSLTSAFTMVRLMARSVPERKAL
jgi:hypothetical protein